MTNIIGIASGKGGVGKTTVVVNLAAALLELENKVCIVDGNVTTSNLGLHLGLTEYPATIHDVLKGKIKMIDAVFIHPSRLHVVPGSLSLADARGVSIKAFKKKIKELTKHYDYIIIDTAPGLEDKAVKILESCDNLLIVTTPELPAIADAIKVIELAQKKKINIVGIVVNRFRGKSFEIRPEEIKILYKIPIVSIIPEDINVAKSIGMQIPVVMMNPNSPASLEFMRIAEQICGYRRPVNLLTKLKKFFRI
ncbi:MAG: cell division ATPase MinD [Candidatus Aenigmatarchaeota archaeon]